MISTKHLNISSSYLLKMYQQIVLRNLEKPKEPNLEHDVFWVCDSFGFNSGRDLENISSKIILHLLQQFAEEEHLSSEGIANKLAITPSRVNHHIRNFVDTGFLYREKKLIYLKGGSVKSAVNELRKDANRIFDELEIMAEEIDSTLGLKNR